MEMWKEETAAWEQDPLLSNGRNGISDIFLGQSFFHASNMDFISNLWPNVIKIEQI